MTGSTDAPAPALLAWWPVIAAALVVIGLIVGIPAEQDGHLTSIVMEGGPVETITALGYGLCAALVVGLWMAGLPLTVPPLPAAVVLLAMGARELDLHHTPWTMSISKIHFYTSPDVPLAEKLLAVAILAVIVWSLWRLARGGVHAFVSALRRGNPVSWAVLIAAGLVVASKLCDGFGRNLRAVGLNAGPVLRIEFNKIEELLELGIPLFVLAGIVCFLIANRRGKGAFHA